MEAIEQLASKNFSHWKGLPEGLSPEALADHLELGSTVDEGLLGEAGEAAQRRQAGATAYVDPIDVWTRGGEVVAIHIELPELDDPEALLSKLGQPGLQLDTLAPTTGKTLEKAHWVYPERGISLELSTRKNNVVGIWLFAPTSAAAYRSSLAPRASFREL